MSDQGTSAEPTGTTAQGQPVSGQEVQTGGGVPNDPKAMQADYSRKTQELAVERKRLETEKAEIARMRQQYAPQQQQYQQPQQNQTYQQGGQNMTQQQLVEQFGHEAAQAIIAASQQPFQQVQQNMASIIYHIADKEGSQKFGEDKWREHDYIDPYGYKQNKVLELMAKGLNIDQAWNALNPVDVSQIRQSAVDEFVNQRRTTADNQPASQSNANPSSGGSGHARSVAEAVNMAMSTDK